MLGLGIRAADPFKRFYQHVEFRGFGFQAFLQKSGSRQRSDLSGTYGGPC